MAFGQHLDNLRRSLVKKVVKMQQVARKERFCSRGKRCSKYKKLPKRCRATCGKPDFCLMLMSVLVFMARENQDRKNIMKLLN